MFIDDAYAHLSSLCLQGLGRTSPNPNVAAAIYSPDGALISDGFHDRTHSPDHAEVVAIKKAGAKTVGATIVVSLEPCAHSGKTPACTSAIIDAGITSVVFAVKDPNPVAAGGEELLRAAGIKVEYRHSPELEFMQRAWLHKIVTGRPLMIWKVAATIDGKVAASDGSSQWISNEISRADVQQLRANSDAILIGTNTALVDNPHLIPKGFASRPVRVVVGEQEIPANHHIFDEQARTVQIKSRSIPELMKTLTREEFSQVLVEAGPTLGSALLASGNIDEIIIYQAPKILGSGKSFVSDLGITTLSDHIALDLVSIEQAGSDIKSHYKISGGR